MSTSDYAQGVCDKEEPLLVTHCMEQNIREGAVEPLEQQQVNVSQRVAAYLREGCGKVVLHVLGWQTGGRKTGGSETVSSQVLQHLRGQQYSPSSRYLHRYLRL